MFRVSKGQVIAIDGKTVRGSHERRIGQDAIHLVNAWATGNGIALGQWKTDTKSNEITAIPPLLRQVNVAGCIVTVDAIGAQTKIAQTIRDEKTDYVLRVKDNQGHLHQDIQDWFAHADNVQFANIPSRYAETDTAYYISSLPADAEPLLMATGFHWAVENSLHWVLDVIFREDDARVRVGHAAHNMAILRQMALNIIKKDPSKASIRTKRFKAALDTSFLEKLLNQI